jgi:hypothetical protein
MMWARRAALVFDIASLVAVVESQRISARQHDGVQDVWIVQRGNRARFVFEALPRFSIGRERFR